MFKLSTNRLLIRLSYEHFKQSYHKISIDILDHLPASNIHKSLWPRLQDSLTLDNKRLVILDDDPTGCQTVYDCNVLLNFSVESISTQLKRDDKLFFILTNTRSLEQGDAVQRTAEIIDNLNEAVAQTLYPYELQILSRSDSTLRGHYPAEVDIIQKKYSGTFDATILAPCFFEGGSNSHISTHAHRLNIQRWILV